MPLLVWDAKSLPSLVRSGTYGTGYNKACLVYTGLAAVDGEQALPWS